MNLSNNKLKPEGCAALAAELPRTRLVELIIHQSEIGDEGAVALAAVIPRTSITSLQVYTDGEFGARGLAAIGNVLLLLEERRHPGTMAPALHIANTG